MEPKDLLSISKTSSGMTLAKELRDVNSVTQRFGLCLSDTDIEELSTSRAQALADSGRLEFGNGILRDLILAFCDSPYLMQENYLETLAELTNAFYDFKTASDDLISDEELLEMMRAYFDDPCQGSLEILNATTFEELCRQTNCQIRIYGRS